MISLASAGRWLLRFKWRIIIVVAVLFFVVVGPAILIRIQTQNSKYAAGDYGKLAKHQAAIVFGAGVTADGEPTPYLKRRLDSAVDLYKAGKVDVLLLSGDNSTSHHNEPVAMKKYVMALGVNEGAIILDYAGFNTYDSCYRAKAIFGLRQAILVSQAYHLPRAIWTCNQLGVKSVGVAAKIADGSNGRDYTFNYLLREIASSDKAALQAIFKPKPTVLGDPEPIPR